MNGVINLLKPPGMTSSNCVVKIRHLLPRGTGIGHGGTLDPEAAGVLPIFIGNATRLFDYTLDKTKTYIGELKLGEETDSLDATGKLINSLPISGNFKFDTSVLNAFIGEIYQTPPMFSALKVDGKPLYKLAHKGKSVEIDSRKVFVKNIELLSQVSYDRYILKVECGKGVYIRTLFSDIAKALGTVGHMSFLIRSACAEFTLENAVTLDELNDLSDVEKHLISSDKAVNHLPHINLPESCLKQVLNGNPINKSQAENWQQGLNRVYVDNVFAGIVEANDVTARFKCMLLDM